MRFAAALSAVLLLCGCAAFPFMAGPAEPRQVPAGLQFTVQPGAASPGGVTTLSLYNGGSEPIGYNLCAAALEKLGGGLWVPAVSLAKACPEALQTLEPGQQASAESPLPAGLEAGDYRFVTRVNAPLDSLPYEQIRSDSFTVAATRAE